MIFSWNYEKFIYTIRKIQLNLLKAWKNSYINRNIMDWTRTIHGSSQVDFRPSSNPTCRRQVEKRVTWNRSLVSIGQVGFGLDWRSGLFGRFWFVAGAVKVIDICKKKKKKASESTKSSPKNVKTHQICIKFAKICTKTAKICWEWLDLAKSHQIWLRTCWISSDLSLISPDLYITSVRSGGSGFGEENLPLDPLALGLGHGNPKLTDGSVGSSWNQVEIGWVGRSGRSRSGLDTPRLNNQLCYHFKDQEESQQITIFL